MWSVGKETVPEGVNPHPKYILDMDSYYIGSESRNFLIRKGQKFLASCSKERFKSEVSFVHRHNEADNQGEGHSIYITETGETFTYHYDTQNGVGKKYNLSFGLEYCVLKSKVKEHKNIIPGYTYYKTMFEICDNFNRALHDCHWPHKRGGKNTQGDLGCHHDFVMACITQNTMNAYFL